MNHYKEMLKKQEAAAKIIGSVEECIKLQTGKSDSKEKHEALQSVSGCENCPFQKNQVPCYHY